MMEYNDNPISLREGRVFIDGIEVMDAVNCSFHFTPDVWTGRLLGERGQSTRWLGYSIAGTITRRRSNNWLRVIIQKYMDSGETPEVKIQGIMEDKASDFYAAHGSDTVTLVGVVLTGDLSLINLDAAGQVMEDSIGFNAKSFV